MASVVSHPTDNTTSRPTSQRCHLVPDPRSRAVPCLTPWPCRAACDPPRGHSLPLLSPQVQYQKCLVAAAPGAKQKGATGRDRPGPAAAGDAASGATKASGGSGGTAGAGARKRGLFSFLEAFRLRRALLHTP